MPAVTLAQRTIQRSQNCGVFQATSTATWAVVTSACGLVAGTNPSGFQSSAGTRTMNAPKFIITK